MTDRTELDVAADTVMAQHAKAAALDAVGLTHRDLDPARQRLKARGYLPPTRAEVDSPPEVPPRKPADTGDSAKKRSYQDRQHRDGSWERRCTGCGTWKPLTADDFAPRTDRRPGLFRGNCRDCWARMQRVRYLSVGKADAKNRARLDFTVGEADDVVGLMCLDCQQPIRIGEQVTVLGGVLHSVCVSSDLRRSVAG